MDQEQLSAQGGCTGVVEVLHVDDNPSDLYLTREAFKRGGLPINCRDFRDGREALSFLRREGRFQSAPRPDLVLLGLRMPPPDGCEVLAEIKADKELKRIPVIMFSASVAEADVRKAYALDANCYIEKPNGFASLIDTILAVERYWLEPLMAHTY